MSCLEYHFYICHEVNNYEKLVLLDLLIVKCHVYQFIFKSTQQVL